MKAIDPNALMTREYVQRTRTENQKERVAPYRPSIDKPLASLFNRSIPDKEDLPGSMLVDWSFLDEDNAEPGELPDWAKRQIKRLERYRDEKGTNEMIEGLILRHKWTRNIPPPSTPKKYHPNEPLFNPSEIFGNMETDDLDDDLDDDE